MTLRTLADRLDRAQQSTRFRIIASALWAALCVGGYTAWLVAVHAPHAQAPQTQRQAQPPTPPKPGAASDQPASPEQTLAERAQQAERALRLRSSAPAVGFAAAIALGVGLAVIWLGLALTYSGLGALAAAAAGALSLIPSTRNLAFIVGGAVALAAMFATLRRAVELAFGGSGSLAAIARNALAEASRLRIALGFMAIILVWLGAIPLWLSADQPLRYRVQSFLQYSVSGSFWILAILTLFFSAATVAFEQRDRLIWQTLTKPVAPWKYLLGKWLGVMALNLAFLSTVAAGVFLYVEYLRQQPAVGEVRAFVNEDGSDAVTDPTRDRLILESQVLTARVGIRPTPPELSPETLAQAIQQRLQTEYARDPSLRNDPRFAQDVRAQILQEFHEQRWSIPPTAFKDYIFEGLSKARQRGLPLTLRYKINAGGENPSVIYKLLLAVGGAPVPVDAILNTTQTLELRAQAIGDDGTLRLRVFNGDPISGATNPWTLRFPPDGLEILYPAGSYEANYARVMATLWLKLGFIAAVAIGASAFLSFPVACLLTVVVLFAAETAGFVETALKEWPIYNREGNFDPIAAPIRVGALPAVLAFKGYASIRPTESLVDGRLVSWLTVVKATILVGAWTLTSLLLGWLVFRKRELAMYSGG